MNPLITSLSAIGLVAAILNLPEGSAKFWRIHSVLLTRTLAGSNEEEAYA
jgi:hypothetical protein